MTANKNFKRLVRARVERTGESYMQARAALLANRPEPDAARRTIVTVRECTCVSTTALNNACIKCGGFVSG